MAKPRNYLLGYGERLTESVEIPGSGGPKKAPYSFEEARTRIVSMIETTATALETLPEKACPNGEAVATVTLHPEYYAKSYFPHGFLRAAKLRTIGSRGRKLRPEKRSRGRKPEEAVTTELFVAGKRSSFHQLVDQLPNWEPSSIGSKNLPAIERVSAVDADKRIMPLTMGESWLPLEAVLHASEQYQDRFILKGFESYLEELDLDPDLKRVFYAGKLCFLRLRANKDQAYEVARFSFLRVLREMPRLRRINTILRGKPLNSRPFQLPKREVVASDVRVAILDGGLPKTSPLTTWTNAFEAPGIDEPHPSLLHHGETVTSAILFGSITGNQADQPICRVDHHRVLDKNSVDDPFELYEVLERVKSILDQGNYDFFNLSMGPELPIDDDEVHAWTAVLDEHLSDGRSLASIAAGNTGDEPLDPILQKWRVQVPSDCVNGLTVGATDRLSGTWARASYSSKGPGRSPGIVKPDLVTFGGSKYEPFWVTDPDNLGCVTTVTGTSYAAPLAMRSGLAVRAHFGPILSPLAIKALLIHSTDPGTQSQNDVGWGRLPADLEELVICPDDCVRVVYQDKITAARYRRIHIPLPTVRLAGMVSITATFCFATAVDPEHPSNYTKSGLSVVFRPDKSKFGREDALHADTAPFFQPTKLFPTEHELRRDAHKWETCLHRKVRKRATSLNGPVFDIHYNARSESHGATIYDQIPYALVLTLTAPRVKDLYNLVVRNYRTILRPLTPTIEVPIRTGTR